MYCEHCFSESPNHHSRCIQCGKPFLVHEGTTQQTTKGESKESNILGWIAGLVVGWYSGIFLLLLMAFTFATLWLGKKILKPNATIYSSAIAFQVGPILMMTGSLLFLAYGTEVRIQPNYIFLIFDYVVPISGLIWLILTPGFRPVVFLTTYQVCALVVNIYNLSSMEVGSSNHKALAAYILWRLIAVFVMWRSYISTKNANGSPHEIIS